MQFHLFLPVTAIFRLKIAAHTRTTTRACPRTRPLEVQKEKNQKALKGTAAGTADGAFSFTRFSPRTAHLDGGDAIKCGGRGAHFCGLTEIKYCRVLSLSRSFINHSHTRTHPTLPPS